jgi:hypothetical protein
MPRVLTATLVVMVVTFSVMSLPGPAAGPSAATANGAAATDAPADAAVLDATILIRSRVVVVRPPATSDAAVERVMALAALRENGALSSDEYAALLTDLATLESRTLAETLSAPAVMNLSGGQAAVEVQSAAAATPGSPRMSSSFRVDLTCTLLESGAMHTACAATARQLSGDLQHLMERAGIASGSRAAVEIDATAPAGAAVLGFRRLGAANDLGAAIIVLVEPRVVPPPAVEE